MEEKISTIKGSRRLLITVWIVIILSVLIYINIHNKQLVAAKVNPRHINPPLVVNGSIQTELLLRKKESNFSASYFEAMEKIKYLKHKIENGDGYKYFYDRYDNLIRREKDFHFLFDLTWPKTFFDVNREVNNGRGSVDFKISLGSLDITLVEFKLASNSNLKRNLKNQVGIYEKANNTVQSIKVIVFFSEKEEKRVNGILNTLGLQNDKNIVLINAGRKPSAARA